MPFTCLLQKDVPSIQAGQIEVHQSLTRLPVSLPVIKVRALWLITLNLKPCGPTG